MAVENISEQINIWVADRSSDNNIVLDNLGVDKERILKCTTHIVLGIDVAIENVFKSFKEKVGRDSCRGRNGT